MPGRSKRPRPSRTCPQRGRPRCQRSGFLCSRSRGEEAKPIKRKARFKARRWVAERTHSWLNRFRRILIRWEKKPENYLGVLHLTLACIAFQASGLFLG